MTERPSITLPGTVEKLLDSVHPDEPQKVQIQVESTEHLYRDLIIENNLTDATGKTIPLDPGTPVKITVEAAPETTSQPTKPA